MVPSHLCDRFYEMIGKFARSLSFGIKKALEAWDDERLSDVPAEELEFTEKEQRF